jgi:hypothetical protein
MWDTIITDQLLITLSDGVTRCPDTAQSPIRAYTKREPAAKADIMRMSTN